MSRPSGAASDIDFLEREGGTQQHGHRAETQDPSRVLSDHHQQQADGAHERRRHIADEYDPGTGMPQCRKRIAM